MVAGPETQLNDAQVVRVRPSQIASTALLAGQHSGGQYSTGNIITRDKRILANSNQSYWSGCFFLRREARHLKQ